MFPTFFSPKPKENWVAPSSSGKCMNMIATFGGSWVLKLTKVDHPNMGPASNNDLPSEKKQTCNPQWIDPILNQGVFFR